MLKKKPHLIHWLRIGLQSMKSFPTFFLFRGSLCYKYRIIGKLEQWLLLQKQKQNLLYDDHNIVFFVLSIFTF